MNKWMGCLLLRYLEEKSTEHVQIPDIFSQIFHERRNLLLFVYFPMPDGEKSIKSEAFYVILYNSCISFLNSLQCF